MLLKKFLANFASRPENSRRFKEQARLSFQAEAVESRCLLSGYGGFESIPLPEGSASNPGGLVSGGELPLTTLPQLSSRPGAAVTVVLKVDGYTDDSPGWIAFRDRGTGPIVTPAFDIDGDRLTFNAEERRQIEEMWYRVSEDYAPFDVNVTTIIPDDINDFETAVVVIGGDNDWAPAAGGWGVVNGFSTSGSNISYVFSELFSTPHQIASASSHESGHTLGLSHQSTYDANGTKIEEYNPGDANSAPIMGVGYYTTRDTLWIGPDSSGPNNIQDDIAALTKAGNQTFVNRIDDHGDTFADPTLIGVTDPIIRVDGTLERNDDIDMFRFATNAGPISFNLDGLDLNLIYGVQNLTPGTNADLILRLYDESGNLIAEDDPTDSFSASISTTVPAGHYFLEVTSIDQYGAIGNYTLTGEIVPFPQTPTMLEPNGTIEDVTPFFRWTSAANSISYDLEVSNLTTGETQYYERNVVDLFHEAGVDFPEGDYTARVRGVSSDGSVSPWSNAVSFTVDIPVPQRPVITSPSVRVTTSAFPKFDWEAPGGSTYRLWVGQVPESAENGTASSINNRVINVRDHAFTTYTHFKPLENGTYVAWVQSFNQLDEASLWSNGVTFTVDVPVPAQPVISDVTLNEAAPTITWTSSGDDFPEGSTYHLWVNNLSTGESRVIQETELTETTYTGDAMAPGQYAAWVRATSPLGDQSSWSQRVTFSVEVDLPDNSEIIGPVPSSGDSKVRTDKPTFRWEAAANAATYELWVNNTTLNLTRIVHEKGLTGTTYQSESSLPQGQYKAWVRPVNAAGTVGDWSLAYGFDLDVPGPAVPTITGPVAGQVGTVTTATPEITWETLGGAESYNLELQTANDQRTIVSETGLTEESYTADFKLNQTTYRVRVQAVNTAGELSEFSEWYTFRIDVANPTTPVALTPNSTVTSNTIEFTWTQESGNFRHEILVRDLLREETIVFQVSADAGGGGDDIASYTNELQNGTYRFWVRGFNSQGVSSGWSNPRAFIVDGSDVASLEVESDLLLTSLQMKSLDLPVAEEPGKTVEQRTEQPELAESSSVAATTNVDASEIESVSEEDEALAAVLAELADPSLGLQLHGELS